MRVHTHHTLQYNTPFAFPSTYLRRSTLVLKTCVVREKALQHTHFSHTEAELLTPCKLITLHEISIPVGIMSVPKQIKTLRRPKIHLVVGIVGALKLSKWCNVCFSTDSRLLSFSLTLSQADLILAVSACGVLAPRCCVT